MALLKNSSLVLKVQPDLKELKVVNMVELLLELLGVGVLKELKV